MYVIGTAGHVDHGKSLLVQALTGIDPDRLREEKERGLTIDLGFAWLTLPSGNEVSIVDVPGHERFIKNMLAGAGGIDLALLVIAADEGVMPQTREHLDILDLLGVSSGVIAITKSDLVDRDVLELASTEALELLEGTTLAGSPLVACSAVTGDGLDELRRVLDERLASTPARRDIGRPRLPVDRSFTIAGLGTVVTGTLIDGALEVGQEVAIVPGELRARIRGLQHHKHQVERALPGRRTAVNLAGVSKDDIRRGQVLALPGSLEPSTVIDVRVRAVASLRKPLRHDAELTLHTGSAEVPARLLLLDANELSAGKEAWAQLRLGEPVAVVKADRFVLRTPNDTVAGGEIVDAHAQRHRRFHPPTIEQLEALREGRVIDVGGTTMTDDGFAALSERASTAVAAYLDEHPLRFGIAPDELRKRLRLDEQPFAAALERWSAEGVLEQRAAVIALPGRAPKLTVRQQRAVDEYAAALRAQPYAPPTDAPVDAELLAYLEDAGEVVSVGDGVVFAAEAYREMVERVTEHLRHEGTITLAQTRDMFATTRKYAQALLEHLDRAHLSRRVGDERVLRDDRASS
jgi:selenocysteine-specific elongation factor